MNYVLTYNHPHRKTQDLLSRLAIKGVKDITVLSTPWVERKNHAALIPHRELKAQKIYPKELAKNLGYKYIEMEKVEDIPELKEGEYVLIGGAGIIPKSVTDTKRIINSHPAYLPYVRGLDAFKWAVFIGKPIGVTTHIISEETDAGWLIKQKHISVHYWDTFHSCARRQYEMEIDLLVSALDDIKTSDLEELPTPGTVNRRMPVRFEYKLMNRFQKLVDKSVD